MRTHSILCIKPNITHYTLKISKQTSSIYGIPPSFRASVTRERDATDRCFLFFVCVCMCVRACACSRVCVWIPGRWEIGHTYVLPATLIINLSANVFTITIINYTAAPQVEQSSHGRYITHHYVCLHALCVGQLSNNNKNSHSGKRCRKHQRDKCASSLPIVKRDNIFKILAVKCRRPAARAPASAY